MASSVKRVVTADVYAWMTPIEGVPGRYHHNIAARGEEIEVSDDEAKRGEGLGLLAAPGSDEAEHAEAAAEGETVAEGEGLEVETPPRAANKAAWVDFAVSQGADRAEAEAMPKDDLVATYGA